MTNVQSAMVNRAYQLLAELRPDVEISKENLRNIAALSAGLVFSVASKKEESETARMALAIFMLGYKLGKENNDAD